MCVLCRDTFSRSDILKRHFQKCSVRRGNPTGASHLSNPAAHLKKSQQNAAKNQGASNADSPIGGTNASSLMPSTHLHQNARNNGTLSSNSSNFSDPPTNPFSTAATTPNAIHRSASHQNFGTQNHPVGAASNGAWAPMQQNARSNNPAMYHSASASPHQFALPGSSAEERKGTLSAAAGVGEEWNHIFQPGENQEYIFPSSMSGSYDAMHSQVDPKKEFDQGGAVSNNYYITPTSLGADGTLGPLLWNLDATREDPLQLKGDHLVDFCFPGGIQDSLQEHQNNAKLRACLTADNIKHFLELFSNFQGHFPFLHMASFSFTEAYDGLIMVIICIGAVYSDRVSQTQVRGLMQRTKSGIERTSRVFQQAQSCDNFDIPQTQLFASLQHLEEIQAIILLFTLFTWHGGPAERASARSESRKLFRVVRRYQLFEPIAPGGEGYSLLHSLQAGEQGDYTHWNWEVWVNQERRLRVMYLVFLYNSALNLYFNCEPDFDPSEMKLPMPCDDAAWDATTSEDCASALGLNGVDSQRAVNQSGSLRSKQLEMSVAIEALYSPVTMFQPRSTNVFSKFILIHALHTQVWQLQRQLSTGSPTSLDSLTSPCPSLPQDDVLYSKYTSHTSSGQPSPDQSSPSAIFLGGSVHTNKLVRSTTNALIKWKNMWDQDMQLQYPPSQDPIPTPRRIGFCRDGVHFYWLARAFLQNNRLNDWQLPADIRFKQVMSGLRQVRDFGKSDAARRGEEPGSVSDIDHAFNMETLELDMKKLFRPIGDVVESPVDSFSTYAISLGV
jgi:Fungal specific transcription factor domain